MSASSKATTDPRNARNAVYKEILQNINESGACPFCPGGYTWENQEILKESGDWTISLVDPRYVLPNSKHHFLLFPRRHLTDSLELTAADWAAIQELTAWARKEYEMPAAILTMRSGDTAVTGATVKHLHAQFFVPKDGELVTCYFGTYPTK